MRKIDTLEELKTEQKRLRLHMTFLEAEIKKDVSNIKESLAPLVLVTSGAKKMLSSPDNSLISDSAGKIAKFLAKNLLFKNSGMIAKMILPFIIKNTTSNIIEDNKAKIVDWVGNIISKFSKKNDLETSGM